MRTIFITTCSATQSKIAACKKGLNTVWRIFVIARLRALQLVLLAVVVGIASSCATIDVNEDASVADAADDVADDGALGCSPAGATRCEDASVLRCSDGGEWETTAVCDTDAGEICAEDHCVTLCEQSQYSYLGCEYFPTVALNSMLDRHTDDFNFAVVVANPSTTETELTIDRGGENVIDTTLGPQEVRAFNLPWVESLVASGSESVLVSDGAYHLVTSMPVAVYQFNPLEFSDPNEAFFSFTNDASLLLPKGTLGTRYMVVGYPSADLGYDLDAIHHMAFTPAGGFFSVVATEEDTEVTIRFSSHTQPGSEDSTIPSFVPGDVNNFTLGQGDVLQFVSSLDFPLDRTERCYDEISTPELCMGAGRTDYCVADRDYDLTGTVIESDKPIAVFVGYDCANIPYNRMACDHLEDQLFPISTWGRSAFGLSTEPQLPYEPNLWRVVSSSDGNIISFTPEDVHAQVTLDAGEFVEFLYQGAFQVSGTDRLLLAQFMVGEDFAGVDPENTCEQPPPNIGDPALGMCPPSEQYRSSYDFLTPETFTKNFVNVIAPEGAAITLDGAQLPALTAIPGTGFGWVRVEVADGAHHMESEALDTTEPPPRFGIVVSGIASYTSYLFPGGLDLAPIY